VVEVVEVLPLTQVELEFVVKVILVDRVIKLQVLKWVAVVVELVQ
jgi:hypothetical protein|tara:strand:- start:53 stop:187 length:135 start_codon:yes stop_codon:yes gene_type:complete